MTSKISYLHYTFSERKTFVFLSIIDDGLTGGRRMKLILIKCTQNFQNYWLREVYIKYNTILHTSISSFHTDFVLVFFTTLPLVARVFESFLASKFMKCVWFISFFHSLSFIEAKPLLLHVAWRSIFLAALSNFVQGTPFFLSLWDCQCFG